MGKIAIVEVPTGGAIPAAGIVLLRRGGDNTQTAPRLTSVHGVPTASAPVGSLALRDDAPDLDSALYVSTGSGWSPMGSSAALAALTEVVDDLTTDLGTLTGNVDTLTTDVATVSARVASQLVTATLTPAAEDTNAIEVTLAVVDLAGNAVERAQTFVFELLTESMVPALEAAFTMALTTGDLLSTTAKPALLGRSTALGVAVVVVTDFMGTFAGTVFLRVTPIGVSGTYTHGTPAIVALTFA